jgi:hypothetical protein
MLPTSQYQHRHSPAALTFPFSDYYQHSTESARGPPLWAVWAPSRLWLGHGWPPELRASVTTRNLARSLFRALGIRMPPTTSSVLFGNIYWYLWLTFCREVTPLTNHGFEFRRAIGSYRSIYLLRLLSLQPRFSHVVSTGRQINPKNETFATYVIADSRSLWINSFLTALRKRTVQDSRIVLESPCASDADVKGLNQIYPFGACKTYPIRDLSSMASRVVVDFFP